MAKKREIKRGAIRRKKGNEELYTIEGKETNKQKFFIFSIIIKKLLYTCISLVPRQLPEVNIAHD